jgi:hypothetical protein
VVDDIPMAGWNIDHIAVTPGAVLAVETKYRGAASTSLERHRSDLAAARRAAHSARLLLKSANVGSRPRCRRSWCCWGAVPGSRAAIAERGTSWWCRARPGLLGAGSSARNVSQAAGRGHRGRPQAHQQSRDDYEARGRDDGVRGPRRRCQARRAALIALSTVAEHESVPVAARRRPVARPREVRRRLAAGTFLIREWPSASSARPADAEPPE